MRLIVLRELFQLAIEAILSVLSFLLSINFSEAERNHGALKNLDNINFCNNKLLIIRRSVSSRPEHGLDILCVTLGWCAYAHLWCGVPTHTLFFALALAVGER